MQIDTTVPEPVAKVILTTGQTDGETLKISKIQNEKRAQSRKKIKDAGMNTTAYGMGVKVAKMMLNQGEREEFIRDFLVTVEVLTKVQVELFPDLAMIADRKREKMKEREARAAAKAATKTAEDIERGDPKRGGAGGAKGRGKAKDAPAKPVEPKVTGRRGRKPAAQAAADRAEDRAEQNGRLREAQNASAGASPGTLAGTVAAGDALIANTAAALNAEQEQRDGGAILDTAIDAMKDAQGLTGKSGLGSISDEKPLSQSAQERNVREQLGLDKV